MTREEYLIALANLRNGSMLGYQNTDSVEKYYNTVNTYVKNLEKAAIERDAYKTKLDEIRRHIRDKIRKSLEYDMGINDHRSDRLFTDTVIELQLIEQMIDDVLKDSEEEKE